MTCIDRETLKSLLGEGFHTAFRKALDSETSVKIHELIRELEGEEWDAVIEFVLMGLVPWLEEQGVVVEEKDG